MSADTERWKGGGDSLVANTWVSDMADVAKFSSSSSTSSLGSFGISRGGGGLLKVGSGGSGGSSTRNRRRDSGEISLVRLPSDDDVGLLSGNGHEDGVMVPSRLRPDVAGLSISRHTNLRLKSLFQDGPTDSERFDWRLYSKDEAEPSRRPAPLTEAAGAGTGVTYLASGFIVMYDSRRSELTETLRCLNDCSIGT